MNIVIFGCDNSGKTTLSKVLDSIFGGGYVHSPGPLESVEAMKDFISYNIDKNDVNIFDRFPIIEESTCGIVLRNRNLFDSLDSDYVLNVFNKIDLFIYCRPDKDSINKWGERDQMEGIKENINQLIEAYDSLYRWLCSKHYKVLVYDYNINGKFIKYEEVEN